MRICKWERGQTDPGLHLMNGEPRSEGEITAGPCSRWHLGDGWSRVHCLFFSWTYKPRGPDDGERKHIRIGDPPQPQPPPCLCLLPEEELDQRGDPSGSAACCLYMSTSFDTDTDWHGPHTHQWISLKAPFSTILMVSVIHTRFTPGLAGSSGLPIFQLLINFSCYTTLWDETLEI